MAAIYRDSATMPSASEMALYGLTPDDYADLDGPCEVWPDNVPALNVFIAMQTQWRVGMGGATGLDYGVLPVVFDLCAVPADDRTDTFECLRVMEAEALAQMRKAK